MHVRGHDSVSDWIGAVAGSRWKRLTGQTIDRFYNRTLAPGDVAFDIGANVGVHTAAMLRAGAHVVAVEPQATLAEGLRRDFPEATVIAAAAGKKPGSAILTTTSTSSRHATLSDGWRHAVDWPADTWDGTEAVQVVTADGLIAEHGIPRAMKIDTEGYDAEVLGGLATAVAHILFEVHEEQPDVARECLDRLAQLGDYELRVMTENTWKFSRPLSPDKILGALPGWGDIYARLKP
jgi:FkbM family methyltransferase